MRRRQLVEIEDLAWCPRAVRDGGTDWLGFMANLTAAFSATAPIIRQAMDATGTANVIDLCSGGGGPWLSLEPELARSGPVHVELSDLYQNVAAAARIHTASAGRVRIHRAPIDATSVPPTIDGVRTMFNAFHHFAPSAARAILGDAVRKRRAIAIFEGAHHRGLALATLPLQLPLLLLLTPLIRPFRWSRLAFTYLVPLIPLLVLFDGAISFLRLYLEDDLRRLIDEVPGHDTFTWDIGSLPMRRTPFRLTYLVGVPKALTKLPGMAAASMSATM